MDSTVTVRFYKVKRKYEHVPAFEQACEAALSLGATPDAREKEIRENVVLRMERHTKDGAFFAGEMVRVQKNNIPPEAKPSGLVPLKIGGLGHTIAFRYHPTLEVMAVQYDNRGVSLGKFIEYLLSVDDSFVYRVEPLVTQNAWDRYNDGKPRKFEIQIAAPANLAAVEGNVGALTDAGRKLAEMSKAPMIRIEISMGGKRAGFLDKDFVTSALKYFTSGEGRNDDVRSLKATVKDGEESGIDPIDFLDEKLYIKDDLSFPENDADQHYKVRENFLRTCFTSHFDYITSVYGKGAD